MKIYRGITYATYERFGKAVPVPFDPQGGVYSEYGAMCPQRSSRLAGLLGGDGAPYIAEGCLSASVYAPDNAANLPVMVWIHGGAFLTGGSEDPRYGCERLVEAANAVVVKISYRLGALGYLYMPSISAVNLGLDDQKVALRWVRDNIALFGGDPSNITVFGQSAGAHSLACLLDCGEELFQKAVLQSPPLGLSLSTKKAAEITAAFVGELRKIHGAGPESDEQLLREATVEEILDAQTATLALKLTKGLAFMPVGVGKLTTFPLKGVKVAAGYTRQDASPFLQPSIGRKLDTPVGRLLTAFYTRKLFSKPTAEYVKKARKRGLQAYLYTVSWYPKGSALRACHCMELPFLLGCYADWKDAPMLEGMTPEEFEANSKVCLGAWAEFANAGVFPEFDL